MVLSVIKKNYVIIVLVSILTIIIIIIIVIIMTPTFRLRRFWRRSPTCRR